MMRRIYFPLLAILLCNSLGLAGPTKFCKQVDGNYLDEFAEIEAQIKLWNNPKAKLDKKRLAAEAAHPQALILDSDQTPVDVIIRRTRT
ncbi:MAG: hypothetical protein HN909_04500, partial [Phycisphaerales bacterium]|nr:hypothetical protein [Phycisphaerales bacterium]